MKDCIKVLMVDDDKEDYLITKSLLSSASEDKKYIIDWLSEYEQALETIMQNQHDVYLIDYRIGANNGLELIKSVKDKGCEAPLILLTGQNNPEVDELAMLVGASDFLVKGKSNAELLDRAIRYEIRHSENMRKIRQFNVELEERVHERTIKLADTIKVLASANKQLKKILEEKERIEEELKESQKLYNAMAKNFPSGLIGIINSEYKFIFIEGTELRRNSHFNTNFVGTNFLQFIPASYTATAEKNLELGFAGLSGEFQMKYHEKIYSINLEPLREAESEITQLLIVIQDVTGQKEVEDRIRKSLQKEIELNELKSRFVSMASHEFRTPLASISTSVSLLKQYWKSPDEEKSVKHFQRINSSIKQLVEILNDFLSLDKLEQGKTESTLEKFDLQELTSEVISEVEGILKYGQQIHLNFMGLPIIKQDRKILQMVMLNLLSNASKYSGENQVIDLSIRTTGNELLITVRDNGIGIPEEDQPFMFTKFFRAKNASNHQGTGLGLNIVKRYVELLNGKISFTSRQNQGTTFTVSLNS